MQKMRRLGWRGWMLAAGLAATGLAATARADGIVPAQVNYQGVLLDQNGNAYPPGNYQLACKLYDANNSLVWGASYYAQVLTNGAYNILLGAAGGQALPGAQTTNLVAAFNGPTRFLGVTVLTDQNGNLLPSPQEIVPRQQILSAPYVITAGQAGQVPAMSGGNLTFNGSVVLNGAFLNLFQPAFYSPYALGQWFQAPTDMLVILQFSGAFYQGEAEFQVKATAAQPTLDASWPILAGSNGDGGFLTVPVAAGHWWQVNSDEPSETPIQIFAVFLGNG